MIRKWITILTLAICPIFGLAAQPTQIETIVFLRHGEKPDLDYGQLKCQGLNRAVQLPKVLMTKFGKADYIFAANPFFKNYYFYMRAVATIEPTAIAQTLPIDTRFPYYEIDDMAEELLKPAFHSSTIYVSWEHYCIVFIVKKIMKLMDAEHHIIPFWLNNDYDSLYVITIDWQKNPPLVRFDHMYENLNDLPNYCPPHPQSIKNYSLSGNKTLVFVPSAERLRNTDQLTCRGLSRALALPRMLQRIYPDIDRFFLEPYKHGEDYIRSLMTIEPTIISLGGDYIPEGKEPEDLMEFVENDLRGGEVLVITWNIEELSQLMRAIYQSYGGNPNEIEDPIRDHNAIYELQVRDRRKPTLAKKAIMVGDSNLECLIKEN